LVSVEQLEALDHLIWIGSGQAAARMLNRSQPTISRQAKDCANIFRVRIKKQERHWICEGNDYLLELERSVHQLGRFQGQRPLRAEINPWDRDLLRLTDVPYLKTGYCGEASPARALELLKAKVIDAYITRFGSSALELCRDASELELISLATFKVHAMAHQGHGVLTSEVRQLEQLKTFSILCWPEGVLPSFERHLQRHDLWTGGVAKSNRDLLCDWEHAARLATTISFDKVIPQALHQQLQTVDIELGFTGEWILAIRKEVSGTDIAMQLCNALRSSLPHAKQQFPTLKAG
jgi:hypothetical protein